MQLKMCGFLFYQKKPNLLWVEYCSMHFTNHFILIKTPWGRWYYFLHFINYETDAQEDKYLSQSDTSTEDKAGCGTQGVYRYVRFFSCKMRLLRRNSRGAVTPQFSIIKWYFCIPFPLLRFEIQIVFCLVLSFFLM